MTRQEHIAAEVLKVLAMNFDSNFVFAEYHQDKDLKKEIITLIKKGLQKWLRRNE